VSCFIFDLNFTNISLSLLERYEPATFFYNPVLGTARLNSVKVL
jgi:hypothetical protein